MYERERESNTEMYRISNEVHFVSASAHILYRKQ